MSSMSAAAPAAWTDINWGRLHSRAGTRPLTVPSSRRIRRGARGGCSRQARPAVAPGRTQKATIARRTAPSRGPYGAPQTRCKWRSAQMAVLIEASDLAKRFGAIVAVDGISLAVQRGEVLGFLGPNGAGKSTTMKILTGFLEPDAGSARIAGIDVLEEPKAAKRQLGYLPEGAPCYGDMTPRAFLTFIAEIRGFDREEVKRRVASAVH